MAIRNSSEIQAIEERLDLADDRVGYQRSQQWTNYLTLDPMQLIQNLLGGGAVQRNEIAIAELEMRAADLIRRRQEVAEGLGRDIIRLVLRWERLERDAELLDSQLLTQRQRVAVLEAGYRTGGGSTTTMMSEWRQTEELAARREEKQIERNQVQRELEALVGDARIEIGFSPSPLANSSSAGTIERGQSQLKPVKAIVDYQPSEQLKL